VAGSVLTIDAVEVNEGPNSYIHGANLDSPQPRAASDSYGLLIEGWVLSTGLSVQHIEILSEERPIALVELDQERPDIASAFPDVSGSSRSGFRTTIGALKLPSEFEIVLRARLEDDTRLPLGRLHGKRRRLPASEGAEIQPLIVNTIGRSGSTLLVTMLRSHPQMVAFSPFLKDARMATYWMSILQDLAEPASFLYPFDAFDLETPHWWLGSGSAPDKLGAPDIEQWLGTEAVESLAAMCQSRIEAFYNRVADPDTSPRYFVEKFLPYQIVPDLLSEVYPGAREVILVRDFRDQLCSVIAFNEKRGYQAFGLGEAESNEAYIRRNLVRSAGELIERLRQASTRPHLVRYEDLILEPERALGELFAYLDVDADPDLIEGLLKRVQEETESMQHHRTTSNPAASIGRWREDLPEEMAELCEEVLGPLMVELGYEAGEGASLR
jgi:hypothetical protein